MQAVHMYTAVLSFAQDPVLFSGTIAFNIDPAGEHDDVRLWTALENAHLKRFVLSLPNQLKYDCGEEGENLR